AELDLLLGELDMAKKGGGSMAAVVGGAGFGKTRLLAAAIQQWTARGGLGLLGICHPHTADTPYAPWRSIWSDFFGLTPGMDTAARVAALVDGTHALAPDAGEDVGLWAEVMGLPIPQSAALLELTAEARQARFFALVQRCFRARTAVRPLLCILENIHWADQASLALIDHLAPQLNSMPLAIAVTFRDSNFDLTLDALAHPICQTLPLQDLTPAEARGLLHALLGVRQLPAAVEQQLGLRDREGRDSPVNPLFLEEAVNVMLDVGVLQRGAQLAIDEARLSQVQLPDTIHGLLLARLDRLPPASRDLLQVASVIGRQFGREPLHRMTPNLARGAVSELLDMLSAEEMTRLVTADPEWIYLFQHAMTHEVAYESLPYARRQALHNGLASWLEEAYAGSLKPLHPILAYHYSRADAHAQALDYAIKAANDARDIFANRDAVELYVLAERHLQALGEAAHWETAVELYLARGHVQILLGDLARAMGDAERGLALAQAHDARAAMATSYNLMAEIQYRQGQLDEVNACIAHVIDELKTAASPDQLARAYVYGGWVASARLEYDRAIALLQQAEAICTATNNNVRLALALEAMAYTYYGQRQLEQALAAMQRSAELSRRFSTRVNVGFALNNVAFLQLETGKPRQALDTFDDAVRIGRETSHTLLAIALYNRAAVHAYLGQFTAARAGFEEAVHLLDPRQHARQLVEAHLFWGYDYCCALGDWEGARVQFARARALIDQQPENFPEEQARLLLGLGYALLRSGDQAAARQTLEEARLLITARELAWWQPAICYYRGLLQREAGDPAAAAETLDAGLAAIEAGGSPDYLPLLLLEAARLLPPGPQRDACLRRSLRSADRRARHADRLRCYREVGQLLADHPDAGFRALGRESLA
ncbi:MAG: AAA family ATPase, partial [Anaerolineales bacterium]|nr:AAA family ATPase [Anaerolineales bacterium]